MQNMLFTLQKGLLLYAITEYFAVEKKRSISRKFQKQLCKKHMQRTQTGKLKQGIETKYPSHKG